MRANVKGVSMFRVLGIVALAFLVQACVTSPYNGQLVAGPSAPVTVDGFYPEPNVTLTIEAYNYSTGAWESLGTTTSASTPLVAAGTWKNSPALYFYSTTVKVSDPTRPQTLQRWSNLSSGTATLRVRSSSVTLHTGNANSESCVIQNASQTEDFYITAYNCGYQQLTVWIYFIG